MRPLSECVFCNIPRDEIIAENELALAFFDRYPVNQGHTLIVPKRHVETYFDATLDEKDAITRLLINVKEELDARITQLRKAFSTALKSNGYIGSH
jgi:diadenosine tetraphosphate (Ap4A) HIT family hydrolase